MSALHPLDHAAWSALTGRHAAYAIIQGGARRYDPAYGVFAAVENRSAQSLADLALLVASRGDVAVLEAGPAAILPGLRAVSEDAGVQMVATRIGSAPPAAFDIAPLEDADGAAMLALAALTEPGPFFHRTHQLGDFVGVKVDGRLVAMAGERMSRTASPKQAASARIPIIVGAGWPPHCCVTFPNASSTAARPRSCTPMPAITARSRCTNGSATSCAATS